MLRNPRVAFGNIITRGQSRDGLVAMLMLGVLHAGFSLALHLAGHSPKMGIPALGRENHYLFQSIFIIPLYLVLFWIGGRVAHAISRRLSGTGSREVSLAIFGIAYAVPMLCLFIIPDILVFLIWGFAAIGKAMRWYAPLAAITCVWLGTVGFSRAHKLGPGRAALAVFVGFVCQAVVGGVFLR